MFIKIKERESMFIDIHCHILPAVDDGADSMIESLDIISNAYKAGTNIMVATPHYGLSEMSGISTDKDLVLNTFRILCDEIKDRNIPVRVFLGSELLMNEKLDELKHNNGLIPINGSRYMLCEFYFDENIKNVYKYIEKLMSYGYIPIIAHPERYGFFNADKSDISVLYERGCRFQINKDSLTGKNGIAAKETAIWMLQNNYVNFVASDCHNSSTRNADLSELYLSLLDFISQEKVNVLLHDNPKRILLDMNIQ